MKRWNLPAKRKRTNTSLDYLRGAAKFHRHPLHARKENRLSLIKRLVIKKGQYSTRDLHKDLHDSGYKVSRKTLQRDIRLLKGHRSFIVSVHVNNTGKTTLVRFRTKASPAS